MSASVTDRLCGIVLREMLPSLAAREWKSFSQGLRNYGDLVGAHFAPAQGGVWAHPRGAEVVDWLAKQGVHGAAQSSWGPTIAAVVPDDATAADLRRRWPFDPGELSITRPRNRGADVTPSAAEPPPRPSPVG
jgi:predicted sugar kinase